MKTQNNIKSDIKNNIQNNSNELQALIASMSQDVSLKNKNIKNTNSKIFKKSLAKPKHLISKSLGFIVLYMLITQFVLGLRADILLKLQSPVFILEIFLLFATLILSIGLSIFYMYPDAYQSPKIRKLQAALYIFVAAFVLLIASTFIMQEFINPLHYQSTIITPAIEQSTHTVECLICIFSSAALPLFLLFNLLNKGATVEHQKMGLLLTLAAFSMACLSLRLAEVTDNMTHLLIWHYLPVLCVSIASAMLGRYLFNWLK